MSTSAQERILLKTSVEQSIQCIEITSISIAKTLLWHTVEIRSRDRSDLLSGLTSKAATHLATELLGFVNQHLSALIAPDKERLVEVDTLVRAVTESKRQYLAQGDVGRAIASISGSASRALSHPLFDATLMPQSLWAYLPTSFSILTDPTVRKRYNENFVLHELQKFEQFFDDLGGFSLSQQQREACIRLEDNNLLVASAGSGKSATMVGKVAYVLEKGLYHPSEILVLAFNKSAADQLKERIARQLNVEQDALACRVTTFHAVGREIIEEVEGRPPQLANWVEHPAGETRMIEKIILELMETDQEFRQLWIDLLSILPKADIPAKNFGSEAEFGNYITDRVDRVGNVVGTLAGIYVKSLQEQRIANWLWRYSVEFEYERQISFEEPDGNQRFVQPDFYYPLTQTIHEHFAIDADGTSPFPNYVEHAEGKRAGFRKEEIDFFETTSAQASDGTLLSHLEAELAKRDIPLSEKSVEQILKAIEPVVVTHYQKLVGVCVKHIRASRLTLEMLLERTKSLQDQARARHFARAVWLVTEAYSRKLEDAKRIDFDSMIGDAVRLVQTGRYQSPYSLILVDEFQDISEPRANLIKALRHQKSFTKVFAVGDDWQSINRFAGSDITIFTQFEANFGACWQGRLEETYRCNQLLADTAAHFVQKNPAQIRKSVRSTRPAISRSIRIIPISVEWRKPSFSDACFRVLERLDAFLGGISAQWRQEKGQKLKVLVLWRYNLLDPFGQRRPDFVNIDVSGVSFHRSKGLEADYTILLDVSEGDYGVPSRIEDDELLNLVIPRPETFAYAEERRLFYVALTRASRGTFLLCNNRKPSRYIGELCEIAGDDVRFETIDGEKLDQCPRCLVGQVVERRRPDDTVFFGCNQFPGCRHTRDSEAQLTTSPSDRIIGSPILR
ncbi:UvrD-helicase domain-containing protein [Mesorhizobium sp. M0025]|uniref:UvrD-helicase domain-containing protein n=1 Tax=Mesorhizobium sp. M0025 TaxID=2956846 RepID=UPI00333C17C3